MMQLMLKLPSLLYSGSAYLSDSRAVDVPGASVVSFLEAPGPRGSVLWIAYTSFGDGT